MQGNQLRKLEAELWKAADQLRANSKLTASEYAMPVLGLIFLRHAYNRFKKVKVEVEKTLPSHPVRGIRPLTKNDFLERNAMFLPEKAHFDYLVKLPESEDLGEAIDTAMKLIEEEYENLRGVLPTNFSIFSRDLLKELLRIFDKEVLQKAEGDLFGKIYEYFLNKFAMTGAQEGGEFFTPMSLVQTIVNIIEPEHGIVFDPACGSAGMFVQTGYFIESEGLQPAEKVTFYGQEKAELNTKLAKMNLAVHGLEGNIKEGNTFYEDKHKLVGKCDFVMANPPFNVDGVDKKKDIVKNDIRLVLDRKVNLPNNDNANYMWILYFYNYLKPTGRAGFVMASSASDAGHTEKEIRAKLVQTGAVDVMVAIGNNFFYTRSLPCTLWFFDRKKENRLDYDLADLSNSVIKKTENHNNHKNKKYNNASNVLMLDVRKIYRKVTQKVNDFSPEQLQNIVAIVALYRGSNEKFKTTLQSYLQTSADFAKEAAQASTDLQTQLQKLYQIVYDFAGKYAIENEEAKKFVDELQSIETENFYTLQKQFIATTENLATEITVLENIATACKTLKKIQDKTINQLVDTINKATNDYKLNKNKTWKELTIKEELDKLKKIQTQLSGNPEEEEMGLLQETEYFWKQAQWLHSRFPDAVYADVEGLCKVVSQEEIAQKDYSLSPGRYVGVDASTEDDEQDYANQLQELHKELKDLNQEASTLAKIIDENFKTIVI